MSLEQDIEIHLEMLMPIELQQKLGVDDNGLRDMGQRVMRIIRDCAETHEQLDTTRQELEAARAENKRMSDQWLDIAIINLDVVMEKCKLQEQLAKEKADYAKEVRDFNAGFEAAQQGVKYDNYPLDGEVSSDDWQMGWCWNMCDKLRAENDRLGKRLEDAILGYDATINNMQGHIALLESDLARAREGLCETCVNESPCLAGEHVHKAQETITACTGYKPKEKA